MFYFCRNMVNFATTLLLGSAAASSTLIRHKAPSSSMWIQRPCSPEEATASEVQFTLAFQQQGWDRVRQAALDASDPTKPTYGNHLSALQIANMTGTNPADVAVVTKWLEAHDGVRYHMEPNDRAVLVSASEQAAKKLLKTDFRCLTSSDGATSHSRTLRRAGDFWLPWDVSKAVGGIFGLHGLPLPEQKPLISGANPAPVTPKVLASTYSISGVKPTGSTSNLQAVAEFQGQFEKDSDLAAFFKAYVPDAQPGDDQVWKFVGDKDQQEAGIEASLDIQYIMGVAPHIKTEFWLFAGNDFCLDLKNWTDTILADDGAPKVHSISYGWQGNLTQVGCNPPEVSYIDDNFAALAAKGVSIIFASGDSGSGYAPPQPSCDPGTFSSDLELTGKLLQQLEAPNVGVCCEISGQLSGEGFTFTPASPPTPTPGPPPCNCGNDIGAKDTAYTGTADRVFKFDRAPLPAICCSVAQQDAGLYPYFTYNPINNESFSCLVWKNQPQQIQKKVFSSVSGNSTKQGAVSGSTTVDPSVVVLYPSWPASSPWITSVGATRFVGQTVGSAEMATDQFGSGGGFSSMFNQSNAVWQQTAVKNYLQNHPQDSQFPPAGSFDSFGRATPDVSALGEGYQVYANGKVTPVGGTSASTPAFAGMVALLNEARAQHNKQPLGFLNPFVYQNSDCFTDVTQGTNAISRGGSPLKYGYTTAVGWDPATGLGTPRFDKLLSAALAAP